MGYQELVEHLRKNGEENIRLLWDEKKAEGEKITRETELKIRLLREEHENKLSAVRRDFEDKLIPDAEKQKREILLKAEKSLTDRLLLLARSCLHDLRDKRYPEIFPLLAKELPQCKWTEVRVNPEDADTARQHFPDSQIVSDQSISGGLKVQSEGGRIHIDNSFEKRLERSWEDMLPSMIGDIHRETSFDEAH